MFALLKKDIIFTKKWIGLSIIYAIVVTLLIMHEEVSNILFTYFLVPFFVTSLPFTKILSVEDNIDTREFIKRLPIPKYKVVVSRVIFILFLLILSSGSLFVVQTVGFGATLNSDMFIKILGVLLIFLCYFMVQLGVFYKYSYHAAQSILVVISFFAIAIGFITEQIDFVNLLKNFNWSIMALIVLGINIIVFLVDVKVYN